MIDDYKGQLLKLHQAQLRAIREAWDTFINAHWTQREADDDLIADLRKAIEDNTIEAIEAMRGIVQEYDRVVAKAIEQMPPSGQPGYFAAERLYHLAAANRAQAYKDLEDKLAACKGDA